LNNLHVQNQGRENVKRPGYLLLLMITREKAGEERHMRVVGNEATIWSKPCCPGSWSHVQVLGGVPWTPTQNGCLSSKGILALSCAIFRPAQIREESARDPRVRSRATRRRRCRLRFRLGRSVNLQFSASTSKVCASSRRPARLRDSGGHRNQKTVQFPNPAAGENERAAIGEKGANSFQGGS
jgi:hypothetical protein